MKLGIVDLDTSHPASWIPIERELGHEIVGVWDGGDVHPAGYAERFAAEHAVPTVFGSIDEMVGAVDCAILHGCDWDKHVEKARPFVEAGKSVLIDKPLAGRVRDLEQIRAWAKAGARISGGSSLFYCAEVAEWLAIPEETRGAPHTVLCGCSTDEFNYGIHAYSMLCGILGPGAGCVRSLGMRVQRRVQVSWPDGRLGILAIGAAAGYLPFYATIVTDRTVHHIEADNGRLYRAMLEAVLPYLAGETDVPPVPIDALLEPEMCAIAARRSWATAEPGVLLDSLAPDDPCYDGAAFVPGYRRIRYPEAATG
jgi:hypothetical protein